MGYKVICSDIDGTLLGKNRDLSEQTIYEIKRIKDRVPIILVSSRMPKAMKHIQISLGIEKYPLVSYNGGLVITYDQTGQIPTTLLSIPISYDIPKYIYQRAKNTNIHLSLYNNDHWYVESEDYWAKREINNTKVYPIITNFMCLISLFENSRQGFHKVMCMGPENDLNSLQDYVKMEFSNYLNIYRSKSTYLELSSKFCSKASALEKLVVDQMGYSLNEAIAFGDNYNDVDMIRCVGLGIAVSNANELLKRIADEITLSNIEDGVAVSIRKYIS